MDYVQECVRPLTSMLDVCLTLEPCFSQLEDLLFINSTEHAYLLGKIFSTKDVELIREFTRSLLWFTYRRNWPAPIGGCGPTSDRGWGCMIRCGQMLLAQCLSLIHLGPKWNWVDSKSSQASDEVTTNYRKLLRMFQDKRTAQYSIHQIAQMGVSEGKQLGEWLGPNTMAQVLKKLVVYDSWSQLVVHVAMDNVLISSDVHIVASQQISNQQYIKVVLPTAKQPDTTSECLQNQESNNLEENRWIHPLLLIIPLRLGLTAINACYLNAVIEFFKLPQCLGILGGRPNHAVYFYGVVANKFLYLDPHVCQDFQNLDSQTEDTSCSSSPACCPFEELIQSANDNQVHSQFFDTLLQRSTDDCIDMSIMMGNSITKEQLLTSSGTTIPLSNASHCSYCSSGSSNCSMDNQNRVAATTTISFPTSSSISKLSSRSSNCCRTRSSSNTSEPEMALDPVMNRFINSFAGANGMTRRNDDQFDNVKGPMDGNLFDDEEENEEHGSQRTEFEMTMKARKKHSTVDNIEQATARKSMPQCLNKNSMENLSSNFSIPPLFDDSSYHCPYLLSMDFTALDPSLALGFLVRDADDYADLVNRLRNDVLPSSVPPLFEILDARPAGWPKFSLERLYINDESINIKEYDDLQYDSDEQFELLQ